MELTPSARLRKARIELLMDEPFFGQLMMQLKPVESRDVPRFRTDGKSLWFNPDYMARLNDRQLRTVQAHEVLHPALLHPYRVGKRDFKLANVAADYAINNILDAYNLDAEKRGDPPPFEWPTDKDGKPDVLIDHKYDGMSFEEIYSALSQKPPASDNGQQPQPQPQGQQNQPGQGQPQPQQPGQGPPKPQPGQGQGQDPNAQGAGAGQSNEPSSPGEFTEGPADEAAAKEEEARWKVALKNAATLGKGQGRLPACMERLVTELLDPKASWREILRTLLTSAAKDDYTWTRPNCRYTGRGLILPSLHVPRMGTVAVGFDSSGSTQECIAEFIAEVRSILFDCRPEKVILIQCDAEIQEWRELDPMMDDYNFEFTMKGGGGTDFRPVFERLDQEPEPPAVLVYLTDLAGSFPDQPPAYPVIWACNNDSQAPFGETVNI